MLSIDGIRFMFTSFVPNFQGFGALAITLIALLGAGVAEQGGLMAALIRKLVKVAPRALIAYLIVFVGVLSSVASDAGYLILIPLAAAAFLAVGRHPIAGLAAGFAGVAAVFMANLIVTPTDAMLFEITNESLALAGAPPISITADYFFQVVSALVMTVVAGFVTVTRRRAPPRQVRSGGGRRCGGRRLPTTSIRTLDAAGCAMRALALLGVLAVVAALHAAAGRAAARSRDGPDHRSDAVHGEPAVHHHAVLPRPRHRVRRGGRASTSTPTT